MSERKNLATCKPSEFLKQTNRLRKSVETWLKKTNIMGIRGRKVEGIEEIPEGASQEEVDAIRKRNAEKIAAQQKKNLNDILAAAMEECPDETLELLALVCFVEPENVDDHSIAFYLNNLSDILSDKDVMGFFTSLAQLAQTGIFSA